MKTTWLISDTHFNHDRIATYCDRPANFTELIIRRWQEVVKPEDMVIHLGDVAIGNRRKVKNILAELPGRKALVLGNHDRNHGPDWWMDQGFAFACQAMKYRNCWLTHEPSTSLADGCEFNIHGHLHNIWHGFRPDGGVIETRLRKPWQRLFAIEYTSYRPVNFDKFVAHPDKYLARGLSNPPKQLADRQAEDAGQGFDRVDAQLGVTVLDAGEKGAAETGAAGEFGLRPAALFAENADAMPETMKDLMISKNFLTVFHSGTE